MSHHCPDCGVQPGATHRPGCDVERCADCGHQRISCGCKVMTHEPLIWSGKWPGEEECEKRGWFAILVQGRGWQTVPPGTPGACPDLNRLAVETRWNPQTQEYEDIK